MTQNASSYLGLRGQAALAMHRFHAWWEGYAFDEAELRARLGAGAAGSAGAASDAQIIAEAIWGAGRLSPGSAAWTMQFARRLSLPVRANVLLFGAEHGAGLADLKHGTRWRVTGLSKDVARNTRELRSYDHAMQRLNKATAAGALGFFELNREPDPVAFARLAAELLLPGARCAFVDFAVARRGVRLRGCFPPASHGRARSVEELQKALIEGGFSVQDCSEETNGYLPMIAEGWAGWRRAHAMIKSFDDAKRRAALTKALGLHAHMWAERFDAMKSGQLRVVCITATRQ